MLLNLRKIIERKKGQKDKIVSSLKENKKEIKKFKKEINFSRQAQAIIQKVAQQTQEQLEWHISEIVTLALASVFDDPYAFHAKFVQKRGKTECDLFFKRDGYKIAPLTEAGGGVIDVASFALRVAMWSLGRPKWRNTLIFDEPFKNINDKTRNIHRKISEMVKKLSQQLKLQFIIITMIPELEEIADRTYEFCLNKNKQTLIKKCLKYLKRNHISSLGL